MNGLTEKATIGVFIVETPLHCGTGQDIGIVDQPIQREKHTNYPRIQGSEIKGVFRYYYKKQGGENVEEIFGPEGSGEAGGEYASCVSFGDARILFFPVKSLKGVYVWITCKDVLDKFIRILKLTNVNNIEEINIQNNLSDDEVIVYNNSIVVSSNQSNQSTNYVVLEEYMFKAKIVNNNNPFNDLIDKIIPSQNQYKYLNNSLKEKLCIVSDNVFKDFVEISTEVITRIKINEETGVVQTGALWTEEYLPTDTILYFPVFVSDPKKKVNGLTAETVMQSIKEKINSYVQIGGNETVGKGFVKVNWIV